MVEIIILDNMAKVESNDLKLVINGDFVIKKKGAEAPVIIVPATNQQESEQEPTEAKNV